MGEYTLLDRAKIDLKGAANFIINYSGDEIELDFAGYHIQQAIEKTLKYGLGAIGLRYPKTHKIDELLYLWREHKIPYNPELKNMAGIITLWATETRYGRNQLTFLGDAKLCWSLAYELWLSVSDSTNGNA